MKFSHAFVTGTMCLGMSLGLVSCSNESADAPQNDNETPESEVVSEASSESGNTFVVATERSFPPFALMGEDGDISGYDIDLIEAIAEKQGLDVEVEIKPWSEWQPTLNDDSVDVWVSGIAVTPEREQQVSFTSPYMLRETIAISQDDIATIDKQSINNLRIAVQKGTPDFDYVTELTADTDATIVPVISNYIGMTSLLTDKADILIGNDKVIKYHLNQHPEVDFNIISLDAINTPLALTVRKGRTDLLNELNQGLKAVMNDEALYTNINQKWFGEPVVYSNSNISIN